MKRARGSGSDSASGTATPHQGNNISPPLINVQGPTPKGSTWSTFAKASTSVADAPPSITAGGGTGEPGEVSPYHKSQHFSAYSEFFFVFLWCGVCG